MTLALLVGTSVLHVAVWRITVPAAFLVMARDVMHDRPRWKLQSKPELSQTPSPPPGSSDIADIKSITPSLPELQIVSSGFEAPNTQDNTSAADILKRLNDRFSDRLPTLAAVTKRLPIALVPFAFAVFILVQALVAVGWVSLFASWWAAAVAKLGTVGAVFLMGLITCVFCNVSRTLIILQT